MRRKPQKSLVALLHQLSAFCYWRQGLAPHLLFIKAEPCGTLYVWAIWGYHNKNNNEWPAGVWSRRMNSFQVLMKWAVKSWWTRRALVATRLPRDSLTDTILLCGSCSATVAQIIAQSQLLHHIMCPHFLPITLAHTIQEILSPWAFFHKTPTSFVFYPVPGLQGTPSVAEGIPLYK